MNALLQQAQQMQEQLASAQAQLAETIVGGTVAGGAVTVQVNGVGELIAVDVRAGGFDGNDAESLADLGDMIVAAYRDARSKADALASEALGGEGGFDMNALLQQAQQMQEQLVAAQQRLAETTVDGTVAGGAVTARVNGVGELVGIEIKAGGFDGSDPDDVDADHQGMSTAELLQRELGAQMIEEIRHQ